MNKATMNPAAAIFAKMTTKQLCEAFEATNDNCDAIIPEVRGWMIDELESRDPESFAAWMDCQNNPSLIDTPSAFFN